MIASLLIANRGEIARRVMRTCRRLGVRTIAVYSEADARAAHVREADAAVLIGPPPPVESYLVGERIIAAAKDTGAEAIHPGYGFLSENADFAEAVAAAGLVWVGPPPAAIRAMGLKDAAKRLMADAGVAVTPGYLGEEQDAGGLAREAARIGWPVMIKAVAGGGGRGMRRVDTADSFVAALESAKREAAAAFGDDRVLLEKAIARPRHIEVQVFGDSHGEVVHLFERDCSLQRRHQKLIEEAPAPGMTPQAREAVCAAAVRAARAVDYVGAGTVEFIADASEGLRADRVWFMEMNTRLQVEHPVTEAITGLDLVEWQLRVASGERLPCRQDEIVFTGHAVEARLCAEDPAAGFLPSSGALTEFWLPELVRIDSAVDEGDAVPPVYDSLVAKLIAYGASRDEALGYLAPVCEMTRSWPVKTNAGFLARVLADADFRAGRIDTGFIDAHPELTAKPAPTPGVLVEAATARLWAGASQADSPWGRPSGFRLNAAPSLGVRLSYGDEALTIDAADAAPQRHPVIVEAGHVVVFDAGEAYDFTDPVIVGAGAASAGDGAIRAPMPGKIVAVAARAGEPVARGAALVTLEAMKMEHVLAAPFDGVVAEVSAAVGDQVSEGALLARVEAAP